MLATRVSKFAALALIVFGGMTIQAAVSESASGRSGEIATAAADVHITQDNDRLDDVTWGS
ncbi:hypothetical protein [Kitasatospora sp. A2-31]|uniref:hypothetical protein n=1 Tax=Kitasatospora sp. A2-31 TaxID=2916414 RepID=UPI001EEA7B9C|nr:hypothetical protein [Kitasatospora sp. A2-31]MCG6494783.1 hypothetical protein [Kitasatospora sp. A2-31]